MTTHPKISGEGDEPHYMMISQSLIFDGNLDLTNNYADKNNIIQNGGLDLSSNHIKSNKDGKYYPLHDIGMPLLYAPIYGLMELASKGIWRILPDQWLRKMRLDLFGILEGLIAFWGILLTSLLVYMLYTLSFHLTKDKVISFWGCLLFGLSPPILSFSYLYFTEMTSAIIILYIFNELISESYSPKQSFISGLLLGFLLLVHTRNIGAMAALGIILFSQYAKVNLRICLVFLLSFCAILAVRTYINYTLWNSWLTTPHAHLSLHTSFLYNIQEACIRLLGWLFDREHGLYIFAPIYCLMFAGLYQVYLKHYNLFYKIIITISMYIVIMALPWLNKHGWGGGWSPAGRFLLPISPLLALGIILFLSESRSRVIRIVIALQIMLNLFLWQFPKLFWNNGDQNSEFLLKLFWGNKLLENFFPSLYLADKHSIRLSIILSILISLMSIHIIRKKLPKNIEGLNSTIP